MELSQLQKDCYESAKASGFWGDIEYNVSEKLMLVVSELGEACEALRHDHRQTTTEWQKDTFEDELADSVIRILDLAQRMRINLTWQIEKKLEHNKTREYKHNKLF